MSDSVRPLRWQPTRLPRPWDSPGKNTGVGCHFLLQCMKVKSEREVAQSCPTLSNPMDCSLPGTSVHGIFQARVLEWVAIAFSQYWFLLAFLKWQNHRDRKQWLSEVRYGGYATIKESHKGALFFLLLKGKWPPTELIGIRPLLAELRHSLGCHREPRHEQHPAESWGDVAFPAGLRAEHCVKEIVLKP